MDIFISLGYPGFRKQRSICMNKIYKLVWSKVRNAWVVTSEIAKGHGKESSSGRNGKRLKLAVMTAILGGCFMTAGISPVAADLTGDQQAVYNAVMAELKSSAKVELGVERGDDSETNAEATAVGENAKVSAGDKVTLKAGRGIKLKQDGTNVQIGLKFIDMDPAGHPFNDAKAIGGGSLAVGQNSVAEEHQATAVGLDTKSKQYGVALGAASEAGKSAVAIGNNALAKGDGSIAIGSPARKVEGDPSQGYRKVDSNDAIAIGTEAVVDGSSDNSTVVGPYADIANSNFSTALGNSSKVKDAAYGTALGNYSRVENAVLGTALGNNAAVIGAQGGVAIGAYSVANRNGFMPGYNPAGEQWSDFWDYLEKTGQKDAYNQAAAEFGAAQQALQADENNPELKTKFNEAKSKWNKIFGTWAGSQGAVSIGDEQAGFTRQLTGLAAGTNDTDAVNVAQLKALNTKVDQGAIHYFSVNSDDKNTPDGTNWKNDGATGKDAIAIGKKAVSEGDGSIAIGRGSKVFNTNQDLGMAIGAEAESSFGSIVIGKNARDYDTDPKKGAFGVYIGREAKSLGGSSQTVIGNYGQAKGEDSTAIGTRAQALGGESLAVGSSAKSLGQGAASFGTDSIAEFDESTALGTYSNGRGNKSVASGNKSVAAGHNSVAIGYQTFAHNGFIDEDAYKALSPEEQKKYFKASGIKAYFLKDTADGNDAKKIGDTYLNTAVGSYSKAYKHATTLGGMTSAKEEGTAVGTYAKAYKKGAASFGYRAQSNAENGVALGAYSFADREKGKIGYVLGGDNSTLEKALESIGQKAKYDELTGKIDPLKNEYNGLLKAYVDAPAKSAEKKKAQENLDAWKAAHPDFLPAVKEKQQMIAAWQSGNGAVSVGTADASRQITNVAAGTKDTDAVNVAQLKALNTKVDKGAIHYVSVTPIDKAQTADSNYFNDGAKGDGGIAIGESALSQGRGIAMGYKANATPKEGATLNLNSFEGIAIGQEAHMEVPGGIALGLRSKVEGTLNTQDGNVNEQGTVALGTDAYAKGNGAAAFGWQAHSDGEGAMAFGQETKAGMAGAAFGGHANAAAGAVAMGWQANAHNSWATSIGTSSDAKGESSTALGGATTAEAEGSTAVGFTAVAKEVNSVALGAGAVANTKAGAVGYIATGGSATFEEALATLNKKEDYDKWTATVNASKAEYDNLTKAFNDASKDKKDEAKKLLTTGKFSMRTS